MTEEEWLACGDPIPMLGVVRDGATERKMQLFAFVCCWRNEYLSVVDEVDVRRFSPSEVEHRRRAITSFEGRIEGTVEESELQTALFDAGADAYGSARDPGDTVGYAVYAASMVFHNILNCNWEWVAATASQVAAYDSLTRRGSPELEKIIAFWRVPQPGQGDTGWARDERAVQGLPEFVSAMGIELSNLANLLRDIFGNPFRSVTVDPRWQSEIVVALATGIYAERAFDRMPILADALEEAGCDHPDILTHCRGDGPHVRGCWVVDLVLGKS